MKPKFPVKYIAFTQYFSSKHPAVDIANTVTVGNNRYDNKDVYLTHDAKIITNSYASDYGYFIEYEYKEDGATFIVGDGHFDSPSALQVGQTYKQGTFIHKMGNTGTSLAVHDHHRLTRNGVRVNPLDYEYVYPDQVVGSLETAKLKYYIPSNLKYRSHIQNIGWQEWKSNGEVSGTTGKSLRLEAIQIDTPLEIEAEAHIENIGWKNFGKITKDTIIGTTNKGLRLECLKLKGKFKYQVHIQNVGWSTWTNADGVCTLGSVGQALQIEAIKIKEI